MHAYVCVCISLPLPAPTHTYCFLEILLIRPVPKATAPYAADVPLEKAMNV